ncbi:MAG: hypothetical protein PHE24_05565 [Patescibacteria group bacterium]|nr:hypothetical protein [Patescibacteria group bacterium]
MFENLDQNKGQNLTGANSPLLPKEGSGGGSVPPPFHGGVRGGSVPAAGAPPVEDMFAGVKDIGPASKTPGSPAIPGRPTMQNKKSSGSGLRVILIIVIILVVIGLGMLIAGKFLGVELTNPSSWANKISSLSNSLFKQQPGTTVVVNNVTPATNQNNVVTPPVTPVVTPPATVTPPAATTTAPAATTTPVVASSSPSTLDSDQDGLTDYEEINVYHTNPNKADSDNDGLTDFQEVKTYQTDPNNPDTDGDGYTDGSEVQNGYNPLGPGKLK